MQNENPNAEAIRINKTAMYFRGMIIHFVTEIEHLIDLIIAHYFTSDPDKRNEMLHIVIGRKEMALSTKLDILKLVLMLHYEDFLTKYPKLINSIRDASELRNEHAHRRFFPQEFVGSGTEEYEFVFYTTSIAENSRKVQLEPKRTKVSLKIVDSQVKTMNGIKAQLVELAELIGVDEYVS